MEDVFKFFFMTWEGINITFFATLSLIFQFWVKRILK